MAKQSVEFPPPQEGDLADAVERYLALPLMLGLLGAVLAVPTTFLLLALGQLSGHSGYTGTEYVGYLDVQSCWSLSGLGVPVMTVAVPLAYLLVRPQCSLGRILGGEWLGGMAGGVLGALLGGWAAAVLFASCGCVGGLLWAGGAFACTASQTGVG